MRLAIRTSVAMLVVALWSVAASAQTETVTYVHTDGVGSVRILTNENKQPIARYDYLPFGELCSPSACGNAASTATTRQFAGKERDSETGLDYFGGRYLTSLGGRFTTVDPVLDTPTALVDPQRWNRYAYVYNNPLRFTDPDGRQGVESAIARDDRALLKGEISPEEYRARAVARGAGGVAGLAILAGPIAWRAAFGCFLSPACQSTAIEVAEGIAGGPPRSVSGGPSRGGLDPVLKGRAGEAAVRASVELGEKRAIEIAGRVRVPDGITAQAISEVKNVSYLSYTAQLREYAAYAKETGRVFNLYVRPDTKLSGPLRKAIMSGDINLYFISE